MQTLCWVTVPAVMRWQACAAAAHVDSHLHASPCVIASQTWQRCSVVLSLLVTRPPARAPQGDTAQWPWQSAALSLAPLTLPYLSNPQLAAVLGYAPALDGGGPAYSGAYYGDEGAYGHAGEGAAAELGAAAPTHAGAGGSSSSENCRFRAEAAAWGGAGR